MYLKINKCVTNEEECNFLLKCQQHCFSPSNKCFPRRQLHFQHCFKNVQNETKQWTYWKYLSEKICCYEKNHEHFLKKNAQTEQISKTISEKKNLNGTFPTNNPGIVKMKWGCRFCFRLLKEKKNAYRYIHSCTFYFGFSSLQAFQ